MVILTAAISGGRAFNTGKSKLSSAKIRAVFSSLFSLFNALNNSPVYFTCPICFEAPVICIFLDFHNEKQP